MLSKILLIAFMAAGCGNDVKIKNNKLESISPMSDAQIASFNKSGNLKKGSPSKLSYQGQSYTVSIYSSRSAQDFINALSEGTSVQVLFTGGTDGNQVVIETIKRGP